MCLAGLLVQAAAQKNVSELSAAEFFWLSPAAPELRVNHLPAHSIHITDSRFDTSKIGYVRRNTYKKLAVPGGLAGGMKHILDQRFRYSLISTSPYKLVIFVKNFWMQENTLPEIHGYKFDLGGEASSSHLLTLNASCEVYLSQEEVYIPLFRFDSVYVAEYTKQDGERLLVKPFEDCIRKAAAIDVAKAGGAKKKVTLSQVEAFNRRRWSFPRFSNDSAVRGIYKTFPDFLNNKPLQQDFTIEFGEHSDEVYIKENGTQVAQTDYWAVCDGKKTFLKIGSMLFEMQRQHGAYDLWGSPLSIHRYSRFPSGQSHSIAGLLLGNALFNKNRIASYYKPLQLNMETGRVY